MSLDHVTAESHGDASNSYVETAITCDTFETVPDLETSSSSTLGSIKARSTEGIL